VALAGVSHSVALSWWPNWARSSKKIGSSCFLVANLLSWSPCPPPFLAPTWLFLWDSLRVWNMHWISYSGATSSFLQAQKCHRPPVRPCKVSCNCDHSLLGVGGWKGKLCTSLFLCNWLVFLTTCEPSTAKTPWLHKPPGGYITHLLTLIGAQGFE
jgi:hypothetical protein